MPFRTHYYGGMGNSSYGAFCSLDWVEQPKLTFYMYTRERIGEDWCYRVDRVLHVGTADAEQEGSGGAFYCMCAREFGMKVVLMQYESNEWKVNKHISRGGKCTLISALRDCVCS